MGGPGRYLNAAATSFEGEGVTSRATGKEIRRPREGEQRESGEEETVQQELVGQTQLCFIAM